LKEKKRIDKWKKKKNVRIKKGKVRERKTRQERKETPGGKKKRKRGHDFGGGLQTENHGSERKKEMGGDTRVKGGKRHIPPIIQQRKKIDVQATNGPAITKYPADWPGEMYPKDHGKQGGPWIMREKKRIW